MYRRLKNILGVSLMILAIVISQVPMPDAQAEIPQQSETEIQTENSSALDENMNSNTTFLKEEEQATEGNTVETSIKSEESTPEDTTESEGSIVETSTESDECSTEQTTEPEGNTVETSTESEDDLPTESEDNITSSPSESSSEILIDPDEKYTVIFDTGIPKVNGEKKEVLFGRTVSELVSINGEQPRILRKGIYQVEQDDGKQEIVYTFAGWYQDNTCTIEWDFANNTIEQNTTIYAKWDRQTRPYYYVTYRAADDSENAVNIPEKQKLYADEKLEKPLKKPSLKNRNFKGWYTDALEAKSKFQAWGKPVTKDLTLYAHFEEKSNTVVFHMNGGGFTGKYNGKSYTDTASLTVKVTTGKKISSAHYPSSGLKYSNFSTDSNWYKDKECLQPYQQDSVVKEDLTLYKKWYYTSSGFTMNAAGNVLYKYSGNETNVTIPDSVKIIGNDAFISTNNIESIILPNNISEVKENAFRGIKNATKDITITGKTESAKNIAKGLANQYTRFTYKESKADDVVVNKTSSESIVLGATVSGNAGTTNNKTNTNIKTVTPSTTPLASTSQSGITIPPANMSGTTSPVNVPQSGVTTQPSASVSRPVSAAQPSSKPQSVGQNTVSSSQQSQSGSSVSAYQNDKTTQKPNITSASAPRSTAHIKDSTPKTGDPVQYRMLVVCALFSVGVLLVLTGNGRRKRSSAS